MIAEPSEYKVCDIILGKVCYNFFIHVAPHTKVRVPTPLLTTRGHPFFSLPSSVHTLGYSQNGGQRTRNPIIHLEIANQTIKKRNYTDKTKVC